jgi:hypothetical protein
MRALTARSRRISVEAPLRQGNRSLSAESKAPGPLSPPLDHTGEGGGKSRPRFAAKRGGSFSLYTIPLWHLLGDGWMWSRLGRAVPSPSAGLRRRPSAHVTSSFERRFNGLQPRVAIAQPAGCDFGEP